MHPILFQLGGFTVYTYGLMVAIGVAAGAWLASREARRAGLPEPVIQGFIFLIIVAGLVGGRIGYVATYWFYYRHHLLEIFMIRRGGLSIQGGVIAAAAAGAYYLLYRRLPLLPVFDIFFLYLPLGLAFGRLGCFFNGCCAGRPAAGPTGVIFPGAEGPVHPTQLYYVLAHLVAFSLLFFVFRREFRQRPGRLTGWFLILDGAGRFYIDRLRGEMSPGLLGLYVTQSWALAFVLTGALLLLLRREPRPPAAAGPVTAEPAGSTGAEEE